MFFGESEKKTYHCHKCGHEIDVDGLQRRDECRACGADLHVCKNCEHWDPGAHNQCREKIAEHIPDREKANFCSFFVFKNGEAPADDAQLKAKARLAALFAPRPKG